MSTDKYWQQGITLVSGCTQVSSGCEHCWSAGFAHRFRNNPFYAGLTDEKGRWNRTVRFNEHLLRRFKAKKPTTYSIWNDFFHEGITFEQRINAYDVMWQNPQHIYMVLTKRIEKALEFSNRLQSCRFPSEFPPHIWLGVSVENPATLHRVETLLQIPAAVRFVSYEPALAETDFSPYLSQLSLIIAGAETGHHARPANPDWFRRVRDQCQAAGVLFFLKKLSDGSRILDGREWNQLPEEK